MIAVYGANGDINVIIKSKNFRDVQNLYQDKTSLDMTFNEINLVTSTCWNGYYQTLTTDITKDKDTGWYRPNLNSIPVADTKPFQTLQMSFCPKLIKEHKHEITKLLEQQKK